MLSAHYRQLLARGKPEKVALVACMRKLMTILNALLKTAGPGNRPRPDRPPHRNRLDEGKA
jgi:transposase